MADLPRNSHRMQGLPLEYTPGQFEQINAERLRSTISGTLDQLETYGIIESKKIKIWVIQPHIRESEVVQYGPEVTEIIQEEFDTRYILDT